VELIFVGCLLRSLLLHLWEALWFIAAEVVFEPVFLGFAAYLIFTRFQSVVDYIAAHPTADLGQVLMTDLINHPIVYAVFAYAILLWAYIKWFRDIIDKNKWNKLEHKMDMTNTILLAIDRQLGVDVDVLLEHDREEKHGKRKTDTDNFQSVL